jgi:hypothetical protein
MQYPMPFISPFRGEISIAPIITADKFILSPTDAMMIANTKIHRLIPFSTSSFSMVV